MYDFFPWGNTGKGVGKEYRGLSLFDALEECSDLFLKFGGHTMAAGVSMLPGKIPAFRERINAYAARQEMPAQTLWIDCKLRPEALSLEMPRLLHWLEPFGTENPSPLFGLYGMRLEDYAGRGWETPAAFLCRDGKKVQCMRFGVTQSAFPYTIGDTVDLAVSMDLQEFRGEESLSVVVRDIRPSGTEEAQLLEEWRRYEAFRRGEPLSQKEKRLLLPDRAFLQPFTGSSKRRPGGMATLFPIPTERCGRFFQNAGRFGYVCRARPGFVGYRYGCVPRPAAAGNGKKGFICFRGAIAAGASCNGGS